jgi:hypothetical protein
VSPLSPPRVDLHTPLGELSPGGLALLRAVLAEAEGARVIVLDGGDGDPVAATPTFLSALDLVLAPTTTVVVGAERPTRTVDPGVGARRVQRVVLEPSRPADASSASAPPSPSASGLLEGARS